MEKQLKGVKGRKHSRNEYDYTALQYQKRIVHKVIHAKC